MHVKPFNNVLTVDQIRNNPGQFMSSRRVKGALSVISIYDFKADLGCLWIHWRYQNAHSTEKRETETSNELLKLLWHCDVTTIRLWPVRTDQSEQSGLLRRRGLKVCMLSVSDTCFYLHPLNSHSITFGSHHHEVIELWNVSERNSFSGARFRLRWRSGMFLGTVRPGGGLTSTRAQSRYAAASSTDFLCGGNHNVHTRQQPSTPRTAFQKTACFFSGGVSGKFTQKRHTPPCSGESPTRNTHTEINILLLSCHFCSEWRGSTGTTSSCCDPFH